MSIQTANNLTALAGVIAKWADNDADPYDRATQLAALAQYLNSHTHGPGMGAPVANLAANVNHSINPLLNLWQRTVQAYTASGGTAGPDHLFISLAGTDTISCTQDTAHADTANGAQFCLATALTVGTGAGGSGVLSGLGGIKLTTDNYRFFRGHQVTRSWRVRANAANTVRLSGATDGTGGTTVYSSYHTGDDTWQTLSVTVTVPADATFVKFMGVGGATTTFYLGAHSTVIGANLVDPYSVALSPSDDLARCRRYALVYGAGSLFTGQAIGTTSADVEIPIMGMGGVSALTWTGTMGNNVLRTATQGSAALTATPAQTGNGGLYLEIQATAGGGGLAAGNATALIVGTGCTLVVEWNP